MRFCSAFAIGMVVFMAAAVVCQEPVVKGELFFTKLRTVRDGVFPESPWGTRPTTSESKENTRDVETLAISLQKLDLATTKNIADAYFYRDLDSLIAKIKGTEDPTAGTFKSHASILRTFEKCDFQRALPPESFSKFNDLNSQQFRALAVLIKSSVMESSSNGDYDRASSALAQGFEFASWIKTSGTFRGILLGNATERSLLGCVVNLQGMGTPIMLEPMDLLSQRVGMSGDSKNAFWENVVEELPILRHGPRTEKEWKSDLAASMRKIGIREPVVQEALAKEHNETVLTCEIAQLIALIECERAGIDSEMLGKFQALRKKSEFRDGIRVKLGAWVGAFRKYFRESAIKNYQEIASFARDTPRQLAAIRCLELIRAKSSQEKRWINQLDDSLQQSFPIDVITGARFRVEILEARPGVCAYYTIVLAQDPNGKPKREIHAMIVGRYGGAR